MRLKYYTSMDSQGSIDINFEVSVSGFQDPNNGDRNARICVALRPYNKFDNNDGYDNDAKNQFDIAQMSLRRWETNVWSAKDMFATNPREACGRPFTDRGETDIDWNLIDTNAPAYDANSQTLIAKFKRSLVGSS